MRISKNGGLNDWMIQRLTGVVIAAFVLTLLVFFLRHPDAGVTEWQALAQCHFMKGFAMLTIVSLCYHAWLGVWTILTDYIKSAGLRAVLQCVVQACLFFYALWGAFLVFGA